MGFFFTTNNDMDPLIYVDCWTYNDTYILST